MWWAIIVIPVKNELSDESPVPPRGTKPSISRNFHISAQQADIETQFTFFRRYNIR